MITVLISLALLPSSAHRLASIEAITAAGPEKARAMFGGEISNSGYVSGTYLASSFGAPRVSQVWNAEKGAVQITGPAVVKGTVYVAGVNNKGQAVGTYSDGKEGKAFIWSAKDGLRELPQLGPIANAGVINDRGDIAGSSRPESQWPDRGVLLRAGKRIDLQPVEGYLHSYAVAINASGQTAGTTYGANVDKPETATIWDTDGKPTAIPFLPGATGQNAEAINDKGDVIGTAKLSNEERALFYYHGGTLERLAEQYKLSAAMDLNNKGQIVGEMLNGTFPYAFLYEDGKVTNLNDLLPTNSGWYLERATSINDRGQIVGTGTLNGKSKIFLLRLK